MLWKILIFFSKKLVRENKCKQKNIYNLHIYIDAHYKKGNFSRPRLYYTPPGTHLLRQHTFAASYQ